MTNSASIVGKHILVVDDYEFSRELLQEIIEGLGCDADGAASGKQALSLLEQGNYDMVFMDIVMPEEDGYAVAQKIRALGGDKKDIPVVAITANATDSDKEKCLAAGMNDHVAKPIKPEDIRELLEKYIAA